MKVSCSYCKEEHDLEGMEPCFGLPDLVSEMSPAARRFRVRNNKDFCRVTAMVLDGRDEPQCFLRTLLEFRVEGRLRPCRWGVWVEVSEVAFERTFDLWNDDARVDVPSWRATLANELPGYRDSLGLTGTVRFKNLTDVTYLTLDPNKHPLAVDQRDGVAAARAIEWLLTIAHGSP